MKYILIIGYIALLVSFISCCDDDFKSAYSNGQATALKNGENWMSQGRGTINNQGVGLNFYFDVYDDIGQLRQRLGFSKVPALSGQYSLFETSSQSTDSLSGCSYNTFSFDGDVIEDRYRVIETGNQSRITIFEFDESNRLLTGEFNLKLFIDPDRPKSNPNNPDTILFEKGEFEVKIEE